MAQIDRGTGGAAIVPEPNTITPVTAKLEKAAKAFAATHPGQGRLYDKYKLARKDDPALPKIPREYFPTLPHRGRPKG